MRADLAAGRGCCPSGATGIINTAAQLGTALGVAVLLVLATLLGPELSGKRIAWTVAAAAALVTALGLTRVRLVDQAWSRN